MFENLRKLFRHDAVQSLQGDAPGGKMPSSGAGGRPKAGSRVPLAVGDSRFLMTNGMFQGARQWMV